MKIIAFPPPGYVGVYRIRTPMAALERAGLATVTLHEGRQLEVDELLRYDLVVWARQQAPSAELGNYYARAHGVKVVFDVDDNEFCIPRSNPVRKDFWRNGWKQERVPQNARNMRSCDAVTTTNELLRQDLLWYNEDVRVLPNQIDESHWHGIVPIPHEVPWIVFSGSDTHRDSLEMIVEPVSAVLRRLDVRLVLLGYAAATEFFPDDVQEKIIPVPWSHGNGYQRWLVSADVVVRPSVPIRFQRCKSENPVLEAGACGFSRDGVGVPIVVSPTTYGETMKQAGCSDLVATNPKEWAERISALVQSKSLQERYGRRLFDSVAQNRLIGRHAGDWLEVYRSVLSK